MEVVSPALRRGAASASSGDGGENPPRRLQFIYAVSRGSSCRSRRSRATSIIALWRSSSFRSVHRSIFSRLQIRQYPCRPVAAFLSTEKRAVGRVSPHLEHFLTPLEIAQWINSSCSLVRSGGGLNAPYFIMSPTAPRSGLDVAADTQALFNDFAIGLLLLHKYTLPVRWTNCTHRTRAGEGV